MFTLAWRNLWRNRGRTLIVGSAIAFSYGLLLIFLGIADDQHAKMEDSAVEAAGGSVLIHGQGYWDAQTNDVTLTDASSIVEAASQTPGVEAAIPRIRVQGLLTTSRGSAGVLLMGVEPELEAELFDWEPYVVEGTWLSDDDAPLVLGHELARELEAEMGDRVVLTASDPDGELVRYLFRLSGILDTGVGGLDSTAAYTTIATAQEALSMGTDITQVGLILSNDEDREATGNLLRGTLERDDIEILTWSDAIPDMLGFIQMDDAFNYIFFLVILLVVAFGIANTFMMVLLERIRELGLLGAIGMSPGKIGRLLLAETVILALVSMLAGLTFGLAIHMYLVQNGIDLTEVYSDMDVSGVAMRDMIISSEIRPAKWALASLITFGLVLLSSVYPAWRASRLDPATAMRTYE